MATLVTIAEYESWSGTDVPAPDEARYSNLLNIASEMVREYAGWHIAPSVTETQTLNGRGGDTLWLSTKRVTALTAVVFWSGKPYEVAWDETGVGKVYQWSADGLVRRIDGGTFPDGLADVRVTLAHGHASTPATIRSIVCEMVERAVVASVSGARRVQMQTGAVMTNIEYADTMGALGLGTSEQALLGNYRVEPSP